MEIHFLSERLDGGHHSGAKLSAGCGLEVAEQGLDGRPAELSQKPALVLEEDAQHPGDGEDDLAVRDIQKKLLSHPLAPLFKPLGMTRWAKSAAAAGKVKEPLLTTVRTADAGKAAAGIAAVQIAFHYLLDDRSEVAVLLLKTALILRKESLEIMEQHPVKHGALRMSGAIDSCHSKES